MTLGFAFKYFMKYMVKIPENNKAPDNQRHYVFNLAVRTGLEPATHGVTGRYSNQLNYRTNILNNSGRYSSPDLSGNYRTIIKTSCKIKLIFNSTKYFKKYYLIFLKL
jgi:hypothetical protein